MIRTGTTQLASMLGLAFLGFVTSACDGAREALSPVAPSPPHGVRPIVEPIYDQHGQPNITHYSANTTLVYSGGFPGLERSDANGQRTFVEQFTWEPTVDDWLIDLSFGSAEIPFANAGASSVDVAVARMNFASSPPQLTVRSGQPLNVPSARPQLHSDTLSTNQLVPFSPGLHPARPATALVAPSGSATAASPTDRKAAVLERVVSTSATRAHQLQRLRQQFGQPRSEAGLLIFSQTRGDLEVRVSYAPAKGGIVAMTTIQNGRVILETTQGFAVTGDNALLATVRHQRPRPGKHNNVIEQRYSDITIQ